MNTGYSKQGSELDSQSVQQPILLHGLGAKAVGKIIAILIVSLLVLWGCADPEVVEPPKPTPSPVVVVAPTPPSTPQPHKARKNWDFKVDDVERPGKDLQWSPYGRTEEASGEWLVVEFTLKNTSNQNSSIHRTDFRIKDSKGTVYNHYSDLTVSEVYGLYRSGDLIHDKVITPGSMVTSYLLFDISLDAVDLQLEFTPNAFAKSETIQLEKTATPKSA